MLTLVIKQLKKLFYVPTEFESYIASKRPTSAAEVDYWARQYDYSKQHGVFIWGRGL
jgi:hypothetical protein